MILGRSCEDRVKPISEAHLCKGPHGGCVYLEVYETVARFTMGVDEHGDPGVLGEARCDGVGAPWDTSGLDPICWEYLADHEELVRKVASGEQVGEPWEADPFENETFEERWKRVEAEMAMEKRARRRARRRPTARA